MKANPSLRRRAAAIVEQLGQLYPDAKCALDFESPLQLLIATILSAQCTDKRVNMVTPALFARFPNAAAFVQADQAELEQMIRSTGFFRNKARNIIGCCRMLVEQHNGQVPGTMEELIQLPGVARKTANVVLGNVFQTPGIPVDTHVGRLSRRMGLTVHTDPVKVERDLNALVPREQWSLFGHQMILHGRQVCHSRKPACEQCQLKLICPQVGCQKAKQRKGQLPTRTKEPRP